MDIPARACSTRYMTSRRAEDRWCRGLEGNRVDKFTLGAFVGAGRIGYVYKAKHDDFPQSVRAIKRFFTDLSTAPEAAESARDRGQSELVAPWPTSVSAAASVHRACPARGEGRP